MRDATKGNCPSRRTSGFKRRIVPCLVVALAATCVGTVGAVPAHAGGPSSGAVYVALGDSYAAGEGRDPYEDGTNVGEKLNKRGNNVNPDKNLCHRSLGGAYGSRYAWRFVLPDVPVPQRAFWACSGARSIDMMDAPGKFAVANPYYQSGQPDQTATVGTTTKWITVSAGGNDTLTNSIVPRGQDAPAGFGAIGLACVTYLLGRTLHHVSGQPACSSVLTNEKRLVAPNSDGSSMLGGRLARLYSRLLDNAPNAVLVVVGYPRVFPTDYKNAITAQGGTKVCRINVSPPAPGPALEVGVPVSDAKAIDTIAIQGLNRAASTTVAALAAKPTYAGRVFFADTYSDSRIVPQDCTGDTPNPAVNGLVLSPACSRNRARGLSSACVSSASFHPTDAGQTAMAKIVQERFVATRLRYTGSPISINGTVGTPLTASVSITAGVPPFTLTSGVDGAVPSWLQLGMSGGTVTVSGTPDAPGSWEFNAVVVDAHRDTATIPVTMKVGNANPAQGRVMAWGWNRYGQIGDGTTANRPTPVRDPDLDRVISVVGNAYDGYAVKSDGTVWAWGDNSGKQLGGGSQEQTSAVPVRVPGLASAKAVTASGASAYALLSDGTVWGWGDNSYSQLGDPSIYRPDAPVKIPGLSEVTAVAAGSYFALARKSDGTVWAWGRNDAGELGDSLSGHSGCSGQCSPSPVPLNLTGVTAIAAATNTGYALKSDGTVWAWGGGTRGELGNGLWENSPTPVQVVGVVGATSIGAADASGYALVSDGTVRAWGYNLHGQLGNGSSTSSPLSVQVSGLSGVISVRGGSEAAYALKADGTVWSWGDNSFGQLGDGSGNASSTPVRVPLTGVVSLAADSSSGAAFYALTD